MDVIEAIFHRRAVRLYRSDPVRREQVHSVLDAANQAPSGLNRQPWEFLVVTGEKIREMGKSYHSTLTEYLNNWEASPMSRSSAVTNSSGSRRRTGEHLWSSSCS